jgi:hypothetical protein
MTNIVVVDPIWANFDIDEGTMLRIQRLIREGKVKSADGNEVLVYLETSDRRLSHKGTLNFIDNRRSNHRHAARRATFNPTLNAEGGKMPGQPRPVAGALRPYPRSRGRPYKALLVADRALLNDRAEVRLRGAGRQAGASPGGRGPLGGCVIVPAVKKEDGSILKGLNRPTGRGQRRPAFAPGHRFAEDRCRWSA